MILPNLLSGLLLLIWIKSSLYLLCFHFSVKHNAFVFIVKPILYVYLGFIQILLYFSVLYFSLPKSNHNLHIGRLDHVLVSLLQLNVKYFFIILLARLQYWVTNQWFYPHKRILFPHQLNELLFILCYFYQNLYYF